MNFEEKVKSLSAKEILQAMIDSLKEPIISVDMATYGEFNDIQNKCFGCAATNTICKISGVVFNAQTIDTTGSRAEAVGSAKWFLDYFEDAIDWLRNGKINRYNEWAEVLGIASLPNTDRLLPSLDNNFTKEQLQAYQDYCDSL